MFHFLQRLVSLAPLLISSLAFGQAVEDVIELEPYTVHGQKEEPLQNTAFFEAGNLSANDFEAWNPLDAVDIVQYLPGVGFEKPQPGSDETLIAIRDQNTASTGRLLVLVDDLPINNFVNRGPGGAPRLNLLQPQNIESVDLLYGPFSAEYSGYASSGVLHYHLQKPQERSVRVGASYVWEDFSLYGTSEVYEGYRSNLIYRDRFDKLSFSIFASRQEQTLHPSQFFSETRFLNGPPPMGPPPVQVNGAFQDEDSRGRDRVISGNEGPQEMDQSSFGIKLNYDIYEQFSIRLFSTYSQRDTIRNSVENYLVNSMGVPVWQGQVVVDGQRFMLRPNQFGSRILETEEFLAGIGLEGAFSNDWAYDWTVSTLQTLERSDLVSDENPDDPLFDGSGRVSESPDTYWVHSKMKLETESLGNDGDWSLLLGYEFLATHFRDEEYSSTNWSQGDRAGLISQRGGETFFYAGFAQVRWEPSDAWNASAGLRYEVWEAQEGFADVDLDLANPNNPLDSIRFPERRESELSPKFSLEYTPTEKTKLTFNLAKAYRFPLAVELFQQTVDLGVLIQSNPNLKPEDTTIFELSLERKIKKGNVRLTFFRNEIKDYIVSIMNAPSAGPPPPPAGSMRSIINLDEVVSHGVEFSISQRDFMIPRLSAHLNASYINSTIESFTTDPSVEGNDTPRVPEWRVNGTLRYRFDRKWEIAGGSRFQSHTFERLQNDDTHDTLGSVSQVLVFDLSARYRHNEHLSFNARIANLLDQEYFVIRPQGQRTFSIGADWSF